MTLNVKIDLTDRLHALIERILQSVELENNEKLDLILQALNQLETKTMKEFDELKQNVADAFRENNETIAAAVAKIESAIANQVDPAELENLNAKLRQQIEANQEFQESLNPSQPTRPAPSE